MKITLQLQGDVFYPYDEEATSAMSRLKDNGLYFVNIKSCSANDQRSIDQNRMQFKWFKDLASQGDMTVVEYRAYCKLHFAVPLLRSYDEAFRDVYDRLIRPLKYEQKLELMVEPIDLPVTSRMSMPVMALYLDVMSKHFLAEGFSLTKFEYLEQWIAEDAAKEYGKEDANKTGK